MRLGDLGPTSALDLKSAISTNFTTATDGFPLTSTTSSHRKKTSEDFSQTIIDGIRENQVTLHCPRRVYMNNLSECTRGIV